MRTLLPVCLIWLLTLPRQGCAPRPAQVTAQVEVTNPWVVDSLKAMPGLRLLEVNSKAVVVRLSEAQFLELSRRGFEVSLVVELAQEPEIPGFYPRLEEVGSRLKALATSFPEVAVCYRIGRSSNRGHPLWALKISATPAPNADKPAVLFYGGLHAQEALGVLACLALAEHLCAQQGLDPRVTSATESTEIWIVPLLNPDGYELVRSGQVRYRWWRKNLRDNDGSGTLEPEHDGVDLNRNFGFNWERGGSPVSESWYYRGPHPFSELEAAALESLAVARRFVAGIGFHSHGRKVLYPWAQGPEPPDAELLRTMAQAMVKTLRACGGRYTALPLNAQSGQSSVWMYGAMGALDFTVELGAEFFPEQKEAEREIGCAIAAAMWLLERVAGPGVRGRVVDAPTGAPLHARVAIVGRDSEAVWPRMSAPETGRFFRLLDPGTYRLVATAKGYRPCTKTVHVPGGAPVEVLMELGEVDEPPAAF